MKLKMFSIYDQKADSYTTPFFMHNEAVAIRTFRDMAVDTSHQIGKNPSDYTLFFLGEWDDQEATVESGFESIVNGRDFKKGEQA